MFRSLLFAAGLVLSAGAAGAAAIAPPSAIPLADFFAAPSFSGAVLSPDGVHVAMLLRGPEGNIVLAIKPTAGGPARIIAGIKGMDLSEASWVNNHRLVFSALRPAASENERGSGPGLHGVEIDGSKRVYLIAHDWERGNGKALPANTHLMMALPDASTDDVLVTRYKVFTEDFEGYTVLRLNTVTGNLTPMDLPDDVYGALIDPAGVPRVVTTRSEGRQHVLFKDMASGAWRELSAHGPTSNKSITPVMVTGSGELYVTSNNGHDKRALYHFDVASGKLDPKPVVGLSNYDFHGSLVLSPDRETVLGVRYETSEMITTWFDEGMKQMQARVDAALPSTINTISLPRLKQDGVALVYSYSDTEPGFWQLYDRTSGAFTKLGTRMPAINPLQMSSTKMVHYKARDGRDIPAYLTMPKGVTGKAPMVVMVHGGPWARDAALGWHRDVQFLASRGYAVLAPEYRGSTGFGFDHFKAGWKQWGRAMQDDIADGVKWADAQGGIDAGRVCIAGASYGGYAVLMGLVNNPELFKCGIDWVGVTDINLLFDLRYTNTSQEAKAYGLPVLIGDQRADAALFKSVSPLENAARITQPLLLAYGGRDRTVPIAHGKQFYAAVKKTNPHVEWVEYAQEGHGWFYERTKLDFWGRVERFLGQQLAPQAPSQTGTH